MSSHTVDIVKANGKRQRESFDRTKLHTSIKAACLSERSYEGEADHTARRVCDAVIVWLEERPLVTSHDIRRIASKHLSRYNPDAAYIYEHHRYTI